MGSRLILTGVLTLFALPLAARQEKGPPLPADDEAYIGPLAPKHPTTLAEWFVRNGRVSGTVPEEQVRRHAREFAWGGVILGGLAGGRVWATPAPVPWVASLPGRPLRRERPPAGHRRLVSCIPERVSGFQGHRRPAILRAAG